MMTGDLILNLSRTAQSSELIGSCGSVKKIDSLRDSAQAAFKEKNSSSRKSSLSKIAQRMSSGAGGQSNEMTGGGQGVHGQNARAPHARYDSSPSSPTNDSTEIDEEIEHDDDEARNGCACVSPNYAATKANSQKCCSAEDKCINYWSSNGRRHLGRDVVDECQNNSSSNSSDRSVSSSRLGTTLTNNSAPTSTTTTSGPRHSTTTTTTTQDGDADEVDEYSGEQRLIVGKITKNHHSNNTSNGQYNNNNHNNNKNGTSNSYTSSNGVSDDVCFSVPTSPTTPCAPKVTATANSVPNSPEIAGQESGPSVVVVMRRQQQQGNTSNSQNSAMNGMMRTCDKAGFRTSRSEDHLQLSQGGAGMGMVPIDIDEDVNSSLNTLLDTRQDSEGDNSPNVSSGGGHDRIVWTYNAPIKPGQALPQYSHSSSMSSSPQHTDTPVSPTSVSSSVMSSNSSSKSLGSAQSQSTNQVVVQQSSHQQMRSNGNAMTDSGTTCPDLSMSEAVSNISSPDYQDDNLLLSSRDLAGGMAVSDPSDSDSTLMVSDTRYGTDRDGNKVVIHVKSGEGGGGVRSAVPQHLMMAGIQNQGYSELRDSEDELATLTEEQGGGQEGRDRDSSPVSDDGSDVESLHSYHYSPKAVDMPSAIRLAKRLYGLDGFKKSDVSRHLSKK